MDCNHSRRFLEAYADGELDLVRHVELEEHLRCCPGCSRRVENARVREQVLQRELPRHVASPRLRDNILTAIRQAGAPLPAALNEPAPQSAPSQPVQPPSIGRSPAAAATETGTLLRFWQVTGLAASIALALLGGYRWGSTRALNAQAFTEAVADHVRSLQVDHLTDVASTDQHTVKPWFAGKLDFAPPVIDLATADFPLTGGRLENFANHPAAALVFRRRQHVINLFIWRANGDRLPAKTEERRGYHLESWSRADLNYIAISDIPAAELARFAAAFREASK